MALVLNLSLLASTLLIIFLPLTCFVKKRFDKLREENRALQKKIQETQQFRRAIFSIFEDVQKAQGEAERAKNAVFRLAALVESSTDAIVGQTRDGIITNWNKGAQRLYGWTEAEVLGQDDNILTPPMFSQEWSRMINQIKEGKDVEHFETKHKRKDGTLVDVSLSISSIRNDLGNPIGVSMIARDITQQMKEQEKFRTAVEAAPSGMVMVDAKGIIVLVNSYGEKLFGYSSVELVGKPIGILMPQRYIPPNPEFQRTFFTKLKQQVFELQDYMYCLRKNGEEFPVEINFNSVVTEKGAFVLSSFLDMSEQKKAKEALRKTMLDLENSNAELTKSMEALNRANKRLEELDTLKSNFVMMASHELRTPLTSVKGYISLILAEKIGAINDGQREFLNHVKNATDRLHRLLSELLDISKIESGQTSMDIEETRIGDLLKEEVAIFKAEADQKHILLDISIKNDLGTIECDRDKIRQVLVNLISNALKYTPKHGKVQILAKRDEKSVVVEVKDTGIGIKPEDQVKIFHPFHRLQKAGLQGEDSTGLGLALAKRIIEAHRGEIHVESQEGAGSKFWIILPIK